MERAAAPLGFATQALQAAAALLAAVVLQLGAVGGASAAQTYSLSSVAEDHLLEFVRQMEVRVDSGMEAVKAAAAQVGGRVRSGGGGRRPARDGLLLAAELVMA